MADRTPRGAVLLGLGVLVVGVLLAAWWQWPTRRQQDLTPLAASRSVRAEAPSAPPGDVPLPVAVATVPAQDPLDKAWCVLPEIALPESSASEPIGMEQIQQMEADRLRSLKGQQEQRAADQLKRDWNAALAARGDERSRALRELLQADNDPVARGRLIELARHTADPVVYAWAYAACLKNGECTGLSPRQWARLDPGNLQPWLYEAEQARAAANGAMLTEALYQIASPAAATTTGPCCRSR